MTNTISCTAAVEQAWERMKTLLFKPFNLKSWLLLAWCAWLANLGNGFNANANVNVDMPAPLENALNEYSAGNKEPLNELAQSSIEVVTDPKVILITVAVVLVVMIISLALIWVRSVSEFVFLDNLINRTNKFREPFKKYSSLGLSSFWWRLVFSIGSGVFMLMAVALPLTLSIGWIQKCVSDRAFTMPDAIPMTGILLSLALSVFAALIIVLIDFFFTEFIVPIMYLKGTKSLESSLVFWDMLRAHAWTFTKYVLLSFVLRLATGLIVIIVILASCCLLVIPLAIPYVGAVLMLPILVFFRLFGLELLNQFYKSRIL